MLLTAFLQWDFLGFLSQPLREIGFKPVSTFSTNPQIAAGLTVNPTGKIDPLVAYPLIMVIYGIGTWVSGGILKFAPLIIGGVICWILAGMAFYFPFNIQLLLLAMSILLSYIIPGHLLKFKASRHV